MSLEQVLDQIEQDVQLARRITHWQHLPARPAHFGEFPAAIDPRLIHALRNGGIEQPYTHQATALAAVLRGENVVVVTPTALGDPGRGTVSLWCMGVNQHSRGTWMNNLITDLHLVTG